MCRYGSPGYNGNITLTFYGGKLENGKPVKDESSHLTFYLYGNGIVAEQPVPALETTEQPESAPETVTQPVSTTSNQGTVYITKPGDNLQKIAKEVYGDKNLWTKIYEQNKEVIKNPNIIYSNMQLILP